MAIPEKDEQKLAAIHERIFGERNRDVVEARAQVLDGARTGSGILAALDALERAVEERAARRIREEATGQGWLDAADLIDPEVE